MSGQVRTDAFYADLDANGVDSADLSMRDEKRPHRRPFSSVLKFSSRFPIRQCLRRRSTATTVGARAMGD